MPKDIQAETSRQAYDLIVIGASEEWALNTRLFGSVTDWVAEKVLCSVLVMRRYEPVTLAWIQRQVKMMEKEYAEPKQTGQVKIVVALDRLRMGRLTFQPSYSQERKR